MTVNLLKRMRCYRGRLMHIVQPYWPLHDSVMWYRSACMTSSVFGHPPHHRSNQPANLWSSHRRTVRRRRGRLIMTYFHDCQECTLEVESVAGPQV